MEPTEPYGEEVPLPRNPLGKRPNTRAAWEQACARIDAALRDTPPGRCADAAALEELRVLFLGRKSALTELLKALQALPIEDKRELGPRAQSLKKRVEGEIEARRAALEDE